MNEKIYGEEYVAKAKGEFFRVVRIEGDDLAVEFLERMHSCQLLAMGELQAGKASLVRWWQIEGHTMVPWGEGHVFLVARMGGQAEGKIAVPGRNGAPKIHSR